MKDVNVIEKTGFWAIMIVAFVLVGLIYLITGFPLLFLLMVLEWVLMIGIFSMFRPFSRKEVEALDSQAAAFVGDHFIRLPNKDFSYFNAIVGMGKPYLAIAKLFKWGIVLFLLLAIASYFFRSVSFTSPAPSLPGEEVVISFHSLPSVFTWIAFGLIISVFWLAARIPTICYKRADFYVMPKGAKEEEGKGVEVAKNVASVVAGTGLMIILKTPKGYFLTRNDLLVLSKDGHIPSGEPTSGKILYFRGKPLLSHMELKEGEVQEDLKREEPIVIR